MDNLVAIMATHHLSYVHDNSTKKSNTTRSERFDPALDALVQFSYPTLSGGTRRPPLSQQFIGLVNSRVLAYSGSKGCASESDKGKLLPKILRTKEMTKVPVLTPEHKPNTTISTHTPNTKDFFGRLVIKTPPKGETVAVNSVSRQAAGSIRFRFHEGFTNAVRRTVYVRDFLWSIR